MSSRHKPDVDVQEKTSGPNIFHCSFSLFQISLGKDSPKQMLWNISNWLKIIWVHFSMKVTLSKSAYEWIYNQGSEIAQSCHKKTRIKVSWYFPGEQNEILSSYSSYPLFVFGNIGKWVSSFPARKCFFPYRFCTLWSDTLISLHSCVAIQNSHLIILACLLKMLIGFYGDFYVKLFWIFPYWHNYIHELFLFHFKKYISCANIC